MVQMKFHYEENNMDYEGDISNSWMIIYSDMITIILCFFIIFFTFTAEENTLLFKLKNSLENKVSKLNTEVEELNTVNERLKKETASLSQKLFNLTNIERDVKTSNEDFISFLRDNNLLEDVTILEDENQLVIRFKDSILFDSGEAEIRQEGYEVLDRIADKLKKIENDFVVEGYTDNVPIKTHEFPSNWELSSARAINVVKFFINNKNINEDRISFSGWGERKPIASNDTEEGRAKNRRIEIKIIN